MPRFAANLSMMFTEWAFLDRFEAAAEAGFDAVEYLFPYAHPADAIAERLTRFKLTQALFNMPPGDWEAGERGLAALPDRRRDFEESVATALRYALATGVKRLHLMSGHGDKTDAKVLGAYRHAVQFACAAAANHGLTIVIEPINGRDMPGYFLNDFHFAADVIGQWKIPNLKLQYDIYHRQIIHGDVLKSLDALLPIIGHVQIAAVPDRHEPGTGELDDGRILRHLDAIGYTAFVGCEYRPEKRTVDGLAWREALGFPSQ